MDNETNLSKEQLDAIISDFNKSKESDKVNIDEFAKKHLNEKQTEALKKAMKNPELVKSILSSPQAKKLLEKLKGDGKKDES
ncbi:MAG: hypothetical protein ACI4SB_06130 [Acutalibacteraceae bacterium]